MAFGKREAQQRADRIRVFRAELAQLEHDGALVLGPEQRASLEAYLDAQLAALSARFDVDTSETQRQFSWGMRITSTLGGMALCAAVVLFFHRVWGALSTPAQVLLLLLAPLVALAATEFAACRERSLYYTSLLSLVAVAAFIMNISVLGTIFNMAPSSAALLAWGAFAMLVAYTYRLRLPLTVGVALLLGFSAASLHSWRGQHWLTFPQRAENFLPAAIALLGVPALPRHRALVDFNRVYRVVALLAGFGAILILSEAGQVSYLPLGAKTVETGYQVAGFLAAIAAIGMGIRGDAAEAVYLGSAFFALLLFLRLIDWWWDWMPRYLFFLLVGLIAVGLLAVFQRLRRRL